MNDLIYRWKAVAPVQTVKNVSLPGGFKFGGFKNLICDVKTATGKDKTRVVNDPRGQSIGSPTVKICIEKKGWTD